MKHRLRSIYLWFYEMFKGHLPPGTLIRFQPSPDRNGNYWITATDPPLNSLGIVVGGWRGFKTPGYTQQGSVVMISSQKYDVDNWELAVLDD